mmetsp:Transcript_70654/g.132218  ORF Transcript_70654/g.132218 Transcript_70654/m.132218 type:complete len:145 (-) Transcript_70654:52-486(-)
MGNRMYCTHQCPASCMSRGLDDIPETRFNSRRAYPVADPLDAQLNWQSIAVRHAWKKAAPSELAGAAKGKLREEELHHQGSQGWMPSSDEPLIIPNMGPPPSIANQPGAAPIVIGPSSHEDVPPPLNGLQIAGDVDCADPGAAL